MIKLAGVLFKEQNDVEESFSLISKALLIQSNNTDGVMLLGRILDKKGKY